MTDSSLKEFAQWVWEVMQSEWRSRTTFGKLFYPLWFLVACIQWSAFLPAVALVIGAGWMMEKIPQLLPHVYKSGADNGD